MAAYLLLVGVPLLGLLGVLEAGRGIAAPLSIAGDWTVEFDPPASCVTGPASLRQPGLSISQSGTDAFITFRDGNGGKDGNDAQAAPREATVNGSTLTAGSLTATISGNRAARTLAGKITFDGCAPVTFRAVRQAPKKGDA